MPVDRNNKRYKKYEVKIYFSSFSTYEIKAPGEVEAIMEARQLPINEEEILSNLENWLEADGTIKITENGINK